MAGCSRSGSERVKGLPSQRALDPCSWGETFELAIVQPNGEGRQSRPAGGRNCPRNWLETPQRSRKWVQSQVTELVGRKRHLEQTILSSQQSGRLSETKPKRKDLSFKARVGAERVF